MRIRLDLQTTSRSGIGRDSDAVVFEDEHVRMSAAGLDTSITDRRVVVAEGRLDRRAELASSVGGSPDRSDAELVGLAYDRWGWEFPDRVSGELSIAVWDRGDKRLGLVRDRFGVRPLVVGSTSSAVEANTHWDLSSWDDDLERDTDPAEIVAQILGIHDAQSTPFRGVRRVPPATIEVVGLGPLSQRRYWRLSDASDDTGLTIEQAVEALTVLLETAVRRSLTGAVRPGSQLSGGLDSSTGSAFAASQHRIELLSLRFPVTTASDESQYIAAVLSRVEGCHHYIDGDSISPLAAFVEVARTWPAPVTAPNHHIPFNLSREAAALGVDVMLDGFDGDSVVSHGLGRFRELTAKGAVDELSRELVAYAANMSAPPAAFVDELVIPAILGLARRGKWGVAAKVAMGLRRTPVGARIGPRSLRNAHRSATSSYPVSFVREPIARELGLIHRLEARHQQRTDHVSDQDMQRAVLEAPLLPFALEMLSHHGAVNGVRIEHPFLDVELVDFLHRLPSIHKLRDGWSRRILRDVATELLPPEVAWRSAKTSMAPAFASGLLRRDRDLVLELANGEVGRLGDVIDRQRFIDVAAGATSGRPVSPRDLMALWPVLTTLAWMRERDLAF